MIFLFWFLSFMESLKLKNQNRINPVGLLLAIRLFNLVKDGTSGLIFPLNAADRSGLPPNESDRINQIRRIEGLKGFLPCLFRFAQNEKDRANPVDPVNPV